jgi:hypothetical protein
LHGVKEYAKKSNSKKGRRNKRKTDTETIVRKNFLKRLSHVVLFCLILKSRRNKMEISKCQQNICFKSHLFWMIFHLLCPHWHEFKIAIVKVEWNRREGAWQNSSHLSNMIYSKTSSLQFPV